MVAYRTSCKEVKGREIMRERDTKRNISRIQIEEDILIGGVINFPMMSKLDKEKYQKRKIQEHEVREGLFIEDILSEEFTRGEEYEERNM
jgi:hypothetical protein